MGEGRKTENREGRRTPLQTCVGNAAEKWYAKKMIRVKGKRQSLI